MAYPNPTVVHQVHIGEQELWKLHHEANDMVVYSGKRKGKSTTVLEQLEIDLQTFSSPEIISNYAMTQFGTIDVIVPYRSNLLDALLVCAKSFGLQEPIIDDSEEIVDYTKLQLRDRTTKKLLHALCKRALKLPADLITDAHSLCKSTGHGRLKMLCMTFQ